MHHVDMPLFSLKAASTYNLIYNFVSEVMDVVLSCVH